MDDEEMEFSRIARGTGKGSHTRDDATSKCPPVDGPHVLVGDISFKVVPGGFEVWYSNRVVNDFPDLVDESADWLEDQLGVLNLGQIDFKMLVADGPLTDEIKDGLKAWWRTRVEDLDLG